MSEPVRRRTILVVDDDASIRRVLEIRLTASGYNVILAADALAAERLVREAAPDLMIVDAHMPYLNGLDFVSAMIADSSIPWVPVVFITGRGELRGYAQALGSACLMKPFVSSRLAEVIERVLRAEDRVLRRRVPTPTALGA